MRDAERAVPQGEFDYVRAKAGVTSCLGRPQRAIGIKFGNNSCAFISSVIKYSDNNKVN